MKAQSKIVLCIIFSVYVNFYICRVAYIFWKMCTLFRNFLALNFCYRFDQDSTVCWLVDSSECQVNIHHFLHRHIPRISASARAVNVMALRRWLRASPAWHFSSPSLFSFHKIINKIYNKFFSCKSLI